MLDIKFIRENADLIKDGARKKHVDVDIDRLLAVDDERKKLLASVEEKRAQQNDVNGKIAGAQDENERNGLIEQMRTLKEELQKGEERLQEVMKEWQQLMIRVPNVPDISVPEGDSDEQNEELRTWPAQQQGGGEKLKLSSGPKNHVELMTALSMADFERGAKVSGFRGYFLKNDGARLNFALWQFVHDRFQGRDDFTPMVAPALVNREAFLGTGYLPQGEEDLYKTQDNNYLSGTAEVAAMGYYMDEVLSNDQLPVKFFAFSPCFRREAGSYGKDTKGLMRVHEFFKFEQVVLCEASHETSVTLHEEITESAEKLMQELRIPYRVVVNCGGDLGLGQVKKYDIESWVPSEKRYRETHSSSYFHDFQSRRLNIRYRDAGGKLRFVHSLNNTALATPRLLISLVENNQQEDGSIAVPDALQPYLGKAVIKKGE